MEYSIPLVVSKIILIARFRMFSTCNANVFGILWCIYKNSTQVLGVLQQCGSVERNQWVVRFVLIPVLLLFFVIHTHTHPFNGPLSGTTEVSRYQKGKPSLDFTEARDSEWQWHQLGHICKSAPRSRQIATPAPHHSVFYRPDALPVAQPTASMHRRHIFFVI